MHQSTLARLAVDHSIDTYQLNFYAGPTLIGTATITGRAFMACEIARAAVLPELTHIEVQQPTGHQDVVRLMRVKRSQQPEGPVHKIARKVRTILRHGTLWKKDDCLVCAQQIEDAFKAEGRKIKD